MRIRIASLVRTLAGTFAVLTLALAAHAQSFTFSSVATLGYNESFPEAPLALDSSGNFFGMASSVGNLGTAFEVTKTGTITDLYFFGDSSTDGDYPSPVVRDTAGNLYGTANDGLYSNGLVFKISPTGTFTNLHNFTQAEGGDGGTYPVTVDSAGNVYGVSGNGIFKLTPSGTFTLPYIFCQLANCADGTSPNAVILDSAGNIYGTTYFGGNTGCNGCQTGDGVVFKLTQAGVETVLHKFTGGTTDGLNPSNRLRQDSKGNLYGITFAGGAHSAGVFFTVPEAGGKEKILYNFCSATNCSDGKNPFGQVVVDSSGNVFGLASGNLRNSVLWEVTAAGKQIVLYKFSQNTTAGGLTIDAAGNLYGTYETGATFPVIFKMTRTK